MIRRITLLVAFGLVLTTAGFSQTRPSRPPLRNTEQSEQSLQAPEKGYRSGYSDGFVQGKDDFNRDQPRDFTRSDEYQRADRKFEAEMGSLTEYQDGYRIGFEMGYNDGFFGRPYSISVPQNLATVVVGVSAGRSTEAETRTDARRDESRPPVDRANDRGRNSASLVSEGDELRIRLTSPINTRTNREGDQFTARVVSPSAYVNATLVGHIAKLVHSGKATGKTELLLSFDEITLADGRSGALEAQVIKIYDGATVKTVDDEGNMQSGSRTRDTAVRGAGGAALGAIIGGIAGGGKGAAIGAAIGGSAGAGSVFVQDGKEILLDSGTEIAIKAMGQPRR